MINVVEHFMAENSCYAFSFKRYMIETHDRYMVFSPKISKIIAKQSIMILEAMVIETGVSLIMSLERIIVITNLS